MINIALNGNFTHQDVALRTIPYIMNLIPMNLIPPLA